MKIYLEVNKKNMEMPFQGTVEELLEELKINPEEVLVVKNGEIVTSDEELFDEDNIQILSVVSGG